VLLFPHRRNAPGAKNKVKTILLAILFALSIVVNAACGFIAAFPLLHWGVTPWTLAAVGALSWPLGRLCLLVLGAILSAVFVVMFGPRARKA